MSEDGDRIAKAATLVMALFVLSRLLGLGRQMIVGALFGTSADLDAYLAANRITETVFLIVAGGALGSAFIPTFADRLAKEDETGAWQLASAVINLALIIMTAVVVLIAVLAPTLVRTFIAPGFDPSLQRLTIRLLRIMLVTPIVFGVSGVIMAALNAQQHFLLPALAPSVYNLSIIGGAVTLGPRLGVLGMAVGVVVGSVLHLLVQVPQLVRHGARFVLTLGLENPSVREVGRLMAPRVLGTAVAQLNLVVNNTLATRMGAGAVSAINFAWMLMLLPQGVFAQAVGTAAFPTFAEQAARGELEKMQRALSATLRAIFFLSIPATVGMIAVGKPVVSLLFERGAFGSGSTQAVAWALAFFSLGLVGHAGLEIVARAFYALHDTFTPVWVGGLTMALNVALSLTLPPLFASAGLQPFGGLALANSVATILQFAVLLVLARGRLHGIQGRRITRTIIKSGIAALVMGLVLFGWQATLAEAGAMIRGAGGVVLGLGVYLAATVVLQSEELRALSRLVRRRTGV
ncbi:MAG: murein biosynthesis integral membrane protein MurJ [Anaerolineae bacterium]|jgi:putative peptidoglycan lipid II flippase